MLYSMNRFLRFLFPNPWKVIQLYPSINGGLSLENY
jgi:hypothetical protein